MSVKLVEARVWCWMQSSRIFHLPELRLEDFIVDDTEVATHWNTGYRNPEDIKVIIKGRQGLMNGFVEEGYQLQKAAEISLRAADARKKGKKSSNYGGGYLELRDARGKIVYIWPTPIEEGKQGDLVDLHSESKMIREIVRRLEQLRAEEKLDNVKVINVLIFTRKPPCSEGVDTCSSRMKDTDVKSPKGWIPQIRNGSGLNEVVLTVWYMEDVNGPTNQGNLRKVDPLNDL